jgi:hypothetical protein
MNFDDSRRPRTPDTGARPWPVEPVEEPAQLSRSDQQWERLGRMTGTGMATALVGLVGFIGVVAALGALGPVVRWALRRWGIEW